METKKTYDFGWGNPYFLLELLNSRTDVLMQLVDIRTMSYAPDKGFPNLVDLTRNAIYESTGLEYPYVAITNGATGAINAALKYWRRKRGGAIVVTDEHNYPFYTDMIRNCGLIQQKEEDPFEIDKTRMCPHVFFLVSSPSNPLGTIHGYHSPLQTDRTIWDAVYHNPIYLGNIETTYPDHILHVGSYSKLLGLTGSRIGWLATHDKELFEGVCDVSLKDTATISVPSQKLLVDILDDLHLVEFMRTGSKHLNYNREKFQKLEYLFDNQPVQEVGMFYCAHADKKAVQLLDKCGIKYVNLGDNYIRLSMGQKLDITSEAVKLILKEDRK